MFAALIQFIRGLFDRFFGRTPAVPTKKNEAIFSFRPAINSEELYICNVSDKDIKYIAWDNLGTIQAREEQLAEQGNGEVAGEKKLKVGEEHLVIDELGSLNQDNAYYATCKPLDGSTEYDIQAVLTRTQNGHAQ